MSYDIFITQGETYTLSTGLKNDDGSVIDLSSYSLRGQVKYNYGSNSYLVDLEPQIISAISGNISIALTASETAALPVTVAFYDVERYTSGDGSVYKVLNGKFIINPEVTT